MTKPISSGIYYGNRRISLIVSDKDVIEPSFSSQAILKLPIPTRWLVIKTH